MDERICYFNGKYLKENEARVDLSDYGLWEGNVYEVLRTYNGIPFKLIEHVDRFLASLACLPFINFKLTRDEVCAIVIELITKNQSALPKDDEWQIVARASRGVWLPDSITEPTFFVYMKPYGSYTGSQANRYETMARWYREGVQVIGVNTRRLPPECLDPKIKSSNRLSNSLAKYEANLVDPEGFPVMLDMQGFITESATENLLMVKGSRVLTSRLTNSLGGITRQTVLELCQKVNIESVETDLNIFDLYNADEIMLTNTNYAIIPVSKINGKLLKMGVPGPFTVKLQSAFSESVNYDIVQRVIDFSKKRAGH